MNFNSKDNIRHICKNPEILIRIINFLPESLSKTIDYTNTNVWWVLNIKQKKSLLKAIDEYKETWNLTKDKQIRKMLVNTIRFIDSLWSYKKSRIEDGEKNILFNNMKDPWKSLEYFLIDEIKRINRRKKEDKIKIEKWPIWLEACKKDFILTHKNIKFWIQLTLSEKACINKKRNELKANWEMCNTKWWEEKEMKKMSSRFISDCPALFIINSSLSKEATQLNIIEECFWDWKDEWFNSWWPKMYLRKKLKDELNEVWKSVNDVLDNIIIFLKEVYEKWDIYKYTEKKVKNLHIIYDWDNIKISYYRKKKNREFIYSLEVFISDNLLRKIWIPEILINKKNLLKTKESKQNWKKWKKRKPIKYNLRKK